MNHGRSRRAVLALGTTLLVAVGLAAAPSSVVAQETDRATLDPRVGVAFPVGGLDDVTDFSVSAGAGVSWTVLPHVALRGDVRYSRLDGETDGAGDPLAPSLDLITYSVGVAFDFSRPRWQDVPLTFGASLGVGATDMSGSHRFGNGTEVAFEQTYPTLTGGARIGVPITGRALGFVSTEMLLIFADHEDTSVLVAEHPNAEPFDTGWALPLTAGVQVRVR